MAQALFKLLKQRTPRPTIHVLAQEHLHPLLNHMPEVDYSLVLPFKSGELALRRRYKLAQFIAEEGYTQAIILPNSWKSALIPFWAKIPRRTGWRGEMRYGLVNDLRILNKKKIPLMVDRFLALGLDKDIPLPKELPRPLLQISPMDRAQIAHILGFSDILTKEKPILVLCPGAEYGPAKRWPEKYFAELAKIKANEGWTIILLGGAKDEAISASIQEKSGNVCLDLTGQTDLGGAANIMSMATAIVTNDSGPMHVGAALNRPLIAIYGSSTPKFTPPLSDKAHILSLSLSCSPCFKRTCPLGHLNCLQNLTPDMVSIELKKIMNRE